MSRVQITSEKCGECHGPYALGVKMGNMIFTTQIGTDVTGETMENAKAVLEAAGASMADVGRVTIYISDINLIPEMNEVYKTYFEEGNYPARCCTQCIKMVDGCLVEMEFTAVIA